MMCPRVTGGFRKGSAMAATAKQLGNAVNYKIVQVPTGEYRISVADVQTLPNTTRRALKLKLVGAVTFSLRLEVASETLAQLRPDQDLGSWLLQKISRYMAFDPGIHSGDSRTLFVMEP